MLFWGAYGTRNYVFARRLLTPLIGRAPDYGFGEEGESEVVHNAHPHLAASTRSYLRIHHCNIEPQRYFHVIALKEHC